LLTRVSGLNNGLGQTPAMGYNTWNDFRCDNISAANIMKVADKMALMQLQRVGYEYVNIDDCWAVSRDDAGVVIPDPVTFPNGMKVVADYVHSKGFKFGIYSDRGTKTCAGRPGSQGYEAIDANTYAAWGVDYLKEDSCYATGVHEEAFAQYGAMRDALNKTGRPIYFSLCGWSDWYAPVGWDLGNSWRISGDVNNYNDMYNSIHINSKLAGSARPGGWNDPDMLVGSSPQASVHLTQQQSRTQFSMWSMMAAPLLIGSNILNLTSFDYETYTNIEVIALDQDPLGVQGVPVYSTCNSFAEAFPSDVPECEQVWAKKLSDGSTALAFVNFGAGTKHIACNDACAAAAGLSLPLHLQARDLWAHVDLGVISVLNFTVGELGDSVVIRVKQVEAISRQDLVTAHGALIE